MKKVALNDEEIRTSIIIFVCFLVSLRLTGLACKQVEKIVSITGFDSWIFSLVMGVIKGSQWLWLSFNKQ